MSASNGTPMSQSRGQPLSEVFNEACAIFFRHCHNRPFCLFHPEVFRRNLVAQTIPIYLRFAIIASAVRYSPRSLWKDRKQKTIDSYAQYAWGQVGSLIGQGHDDIPIIQSLALLAIIDATAGRRQAAWVKIGIAVRISQDLLMMVEPESHLSDAEQDERRNLFWSLYLLDRFVCCAFRRPPAIRSSDCLLNLPRDDGLGSSNPPTTLRELLDQESDIKRLQPGAFGLSIGLAAVLGDTVDYMMRDEVGNAPWHADAQYNVIQNKLEYLNELTTIHGNSVASLEEPPTQAELNPHDRRQVTHLVLSHTLYHLAHCILKHPFLLGAKLQLHGVQELPSPWIEETRRSCLAHACSLTQVLVDAQAAGYMLVPSFYSYCVLVAGTIHGLYLYGGDALTSDTASKNIARSLAYLTQISEVWDPAQMIADVLRFFTNRCVRYSNVLLHQKLRMQELTATDLTVLRLVLDFWAMMDPKNPVTELSSLNIDCFADLSAVDREISTSASPDSADQYATQMNNIMSFSESGSDGCVDPNILFDRQPSRQSPSDDPAHWDWDKEIDALEVRPSPAA